MRFHSWGKLGLALVLLLCFAVPTMSALGEDLTHYMLMGFDFLGDTTIGTSFSDANLLVTIDKEHSQILLTSIMRDSYIPLPEGGHSKLNGITRKYDIATHIEAVEQALGIDIAGYAAINEPGFSRIVNEMGGLEITLSNEEYQSLKNRDMVDGIPGPGTHLLPGKAVYAYLMDRYMGGGDGARTGKARDVAVVVIERVKSMPWNEVLVLMSMSLEEIEMNISLSVILTELAAVYQMKDLDIRQLQLPIEGAFWYDTVNGSSTVRWNWDKNLAAFDAFLHQEE